MSPCNIWTQYGYKQVEQILGLQIQYQKPKQNYFVPVLISNCLSHLVWSFAICTENPALSEITQTFLRELRRA